MKITKFEPIPIRIPFHKTFVMATPHEQSRNFIECLVLKIHTDEGMVGIGETTAWRRQGASEVLTNLVTIMKEIYEPLVLGKSPLNINEIMLSLNSALYNVLYPQAAVSDALYDLAGKIFDVPVYQLIGGKCHERIKVGVCLSAHGSPEETVQEAQKFYENGYRHIRIKIGINPDADVRNAKALRESYGDDIYLRADANAYLDFPEALRLIKKLEPFDFELIEQPVALWNLQGMADLCRHTTVPISADESLSTVYSMADIIRTRAACVIQTKQAKNGGIHYIRQLWNMADAAGLKIFPGNHPATSISVAATAHLCASWGGRMMIGDFHNGLAVMLADDIVTNRIEAVDGFIKVPELPGLGVQLDEEKIEKYRVDK
jgi:muconate cycloisomerase